ncbi:non-structural maintenance of chromosomes element 1 homolog [Acipenser ruthenus]|uniref:non-structural maintenance of chromosomes element 1 homolog n=1 Tax=Acipenser ruthenus TaxID=7906 RepID=UPI0027403DFA|nr:non-structural maintenance of chromosomes element 1 homolog [Acipenser ruthenus]
MQIRKGMSEEDGQQYYALMDLIAESENGTACSTDYLNLAHKLQSKKMKKKEVEVVLQRLVVDKWLCEKNGDGQYIQNMYQDLVKLGNTCHNTAIQGNPGVAKGELV